MYSDHHLPADWFQTEPVLVKSWGGRVSLLTGFPHEKQVNLQYWANDDSRRNHIARILLHAARPDCRQAVIDTLQDAYPGWPFDALCD